MDSKAKFHIVPKRDFGNRPFLINGKWVSSGFVVTLNGCNCMPAATWFQTIPSALQAIRVLEKSQGNSDRFWKLLHRVNGATALARAQ